MDLEFLFIVWDEIKTPDWLFSLLALEQFRG